MDEAVTTGAKGNLRNALTIAERFYLLAVILESNNPDVVNKAYGLLTNIRGKKYTTNYIKDIVIGTDMQTKYKSRRKTPEEKAETRRRYYLAHKAEINERTKRWRETHPERYAELKRRIADRNRKRKNEYACRK